MTSQIDLPEILHADLLNLIRIKAFFKFIRFQMFIRFQKQTAGRIPETLTGILNIFYFRGYALKQRMHAMQNGLKK